MDRRHFLELTMASSKLGGFYILLPMDLILDERRPGDVTVLEVVNGPVEFVDTRNNKRAGKVFLKPTNTVVGGIAFGQPYQAPFSVR